MTNTVSMVAGPHDTTFLRRRWEQPDATADLLLVHGLYEHSGRWDHVGSYFAAHGYDVTMFDLRGHGETSGPVLDTTPFSLFLDDLEWMLTETATPDRPTVVYSHSTGSLISIRYAETGRQPLPVAWVWSAPVLGENTPPWLVAVGRGIAKVAPTIRMSDKPKPDALSRDPAVGEAYFGDPLVRFKVTTRMAVGVLDAIDDANASLDDLEVNALTIHGTDDSLIPPASSAPLGGVPGIERKLYPGYRHELHNEPTYEEVLGDADRYFRSQLAG